MAKATRKSKPATPKKKTAKKSAKKAKASKVTKKKSASAKASKKASGSAKSKSKAKKASPAKAAKAVAKPAKSKAAKAAKPAPEKTVAVVEKPAKKARAGKRSKSPRPGSPKRLGAAKGSASKRVEVVEEEEVDDVFKEPPPPLFDAEKLAEIRDRLVVLLRDLNAEIESEVNEARDRDLDHITDESDIASDSAEGDLALSLAEATGVEAAEIIRAIEKIDENTYGYCDVTGKAINPERLEFLPWATRSVESQARMELRQRRDSNGFEPEFDGADARSNDDD